MKQQELIERYIYAVTRHMKKDEREDVAKELQSIIEDMLLERCSEEEPNEATVKDVLNELGNPSDLYEKYSVDGKDYLIGAPYYGVYKSVMRTVLLHGGLRLCIRGSNARPVRRVNTICIQYDGELQFNSVIAVSQKKKHTHVHLPRPDDVQTNASCIYYPVAVLFNIYSKYYNQ